MSKVDHKEEEAPSAFREQEARLAAALRKAEGSTAETAKEIEPSEELEKALNPEPEPSKVPAAVPSFTLSPREEPPRKMHKVILSADTLTIHFEVLEVNVDQENSAIALLLPAGFDLRPELECAFKLTVRGTVFDVFYAGSRMQLASLGGLLISFVARKVEDDQDRTS